VTRSRALDLAAYGGAAASLALGAIAYVALRGGLRLHGAARAAIGDASIDRLRAFARAADLPPWVRFNLPDALWQFAFCLVVFRIWRGAPWTAGKIAACVLPIAIGMLVEIGQRFGVVEGTFDLADLAASAIAAIAAALVVRP
jgi:hypothetical protein